MGCFLSATADNLQGQMEGVAVAAMAYSLVFFAWAFACAVQGDYPKAAKRLLASGAFGGLYYGISAVAKASSFKLVDAMDCGRALSVPPEAVEKIRGSIAPYLASKPFLQHQLPDHRDIKWISKGQSKIFSLSDGFSELVFKWGVASDWTCDQIIKATDVVSDNHFNLLYVPSAKKLVFENAIGDRIALIVQEKLQFNGEKWVQGLLYKQYSAKMGETIQQLTKFISLTEFSDMKWPNAVFPLSMDDSLPPQLILHDLDQFGGAHCGLFGDPRAHHGYGHPGLIGCLWEEKAIDGVIEQARELGVVFSEEEAETAKRARLSAIDLENKMINFYQEKGITFRGEEPLVVDIEELDLNLTEQGLDADEMPISMREIAQRIIHEINQRITHAANSCGYFDKRRIGSFTVGDARLSWESVLQFEQVINALVEKRHIFQARFRFPAIYELQV
jgi:hypothetical protein